MFFRCMSKFRIKIYIEKVSKYHQTTLNNPSKSGSFIVSNIYGKTIKKMYIKIISNYIEVYWIYYEFKIYFYFMNAIELHRNLMTYRVVIEKFPKSTKIFNLWVCKGIFYLRKTCKHKINNFKIYSFY